MVDFTIDTNSEWITVEGLRFAPAEADNLKSAVSFAGGMRDFPGLPPFIEFEQFTVEFTEDGTLRVARINNNTRHIYMEQSPEMQLNQ